MLELLIGVQRMLWTSYKLVITCCDGHVIMACSRSVLWYVPTCAKVVNTGCFVESCQPPLVVFAAARIVDFDVLHMHLRQLVYRLLDFTARNTQKLSHKGDLLSHYARLEFSIHRYKIDPDKNINCHNNVSKFVFSEILYTYIIPLSSLIFLVEKLVWAPEPFQSWTGFGSKVTITPYSSASLCSKYRATQRSSAAVTPKDGPTWNSHWDGMTSAFVPEIGTPANRQHLWTR